MILHVCDSAGIVILNSVMQINKYVYVLEAGFVTLDTEGKDIDCSESVKMNYSFPSAFLMKLVKLNDITYIF